MYYIKCNVVFSRISWYVFEYLFLRRDCLYWQNIEDLYLYMQRFKKTLKAPWNMKMVLMILVLIRLISRAGHLRCKMSLSTILSDIGLILLLWLCPFILLNPSTYLRGKHSFFVLMICYLARNSVSFFVFCFLSFG